MGTREIGIFALGTVLAPGELLPLHIFEERYKQLIGDSLESGDPFLLLYSDDDGTRELGCAASVIEVLQRYDDGRMNIVVEGGDLLRVVEMTRGRSYATGVVEGVADDPAVGEEREAALQIYRTFATASGLDLEDDDLEGHERPLSYVIMSRVDFPAADKQRILEMRSERERLMALVELLSRGLQSLQQLEQIRKRAQTNGKVPHG
jgi:Lon protease-like protein